MAIPTSILQSETVDLQPLVVTRNDSRQIPFAVLDENGDPIPLPGCTVTATIRDAYDGTSLWSHTATPDGDGNAVNIITAAQAAGFTWTADGTGRQLIGVCDWQISDGTLVHTPCRALVYALKDVTT